MLKLKIKAQTNSPLSKLFKISPPDICRDDKWIQKLFRSPVFSSALLFSLICGVRCGGALLSCGCSVRTADVPQHHCSPLRMNHANHLMDINTVTDWHLVSVVHLRTFLLQRCVQAVFIFILSIWHFKCCSWCHFIWRFSVWEHEILPAVLQVILWKPVWVKGWKLSLQN